MASLNNAKSLYRRTLIESVSVRRFTGTGAGRTSTDYATKGKFIGRKSDIVGGIVSQYDFDVIILVEPLIELGFVFPIRNSDFIVKNGKDYGIIFPDEHTREVEDFTIAYVLQVKGR